VSVAYRFGSFELQPIQRRLFADGEAVALGARAFDVLLTLVERAGELVTKQALLDSAWPGLVVEENNLQVQIGTLRKLLGAQAIATIPGRGYRFALALESARFQLAVRWLGWSATWAPPAEHRRDWLAEARRAAA